MSPSAAGTDRNSEQAKTRIRRSVCCVSARAWCVVGCGARWRRPEPIATSQSNRNTYAHTQAAPLACSSPGSTDTTSSQRRAALTLTLTPPFAESPTFVSIQRPNVFRVCVRPPTRSGIRLAALSIEPYAEPHVRSRGGGCSSSASGRSSFFLRALALSSGVGSSRHYTTHVPHHHPSSSQTPIRGGGRATPRRST